LLTKDSYQRSRLRVYFLVILEPNKFRRNSSVNIVTVLNKQGILVWLMTKAKDLCFPRWPWILSASISTDINNPLPAVKVSERETVDISSFSAVITKTHNTRITEHWAVLLQPFLLWISSKYYIFWMYVCSPR
jgi:hypothetical protein